MKQIHVQWAHWHHWCRYFTANAHTPPPMKPERDSSRLAYRVMAARVADRASLPKSAPPHLALQGALPRKTGQSGGAVVSAAQMLHRHRYVAEGVVAAGYRRPVPAPVHIPIAVDPGPTHQRLLVVILSGALHSAASTLEKDQIGRRMGGQEIPGERPVWRIVASGPLIICL
jgi:hypothetical protein